MALVTSRGLVVIFLGLSLGIAGTHYGVEEFVLVSVAAGVMVVTGIGWLSWRASLARRSLRVMATTSTEATVGRPCEAELVLRNEGRWRCPPLVVEDPAPRWSLSHPGLARGTERGRSLPGSGSGSGSLRGLSFAHGRMPIKNGQLQVGVGWSAEGRSADTRRGGGRLRRTGGEWRALRDGSSVPGTGSGAEVQLGLDVPTGSRGLLTLLPVGVWCEDPFRLFALRVARTPTAHILVCPDPEAAGIRAGTSTRGGGGRRPDPVAPLGGEGTEAGYEFRGLRPYVPGDRMARLHWQAYARSGDLAVRDFAEPKSGNVSLLVDLRPSAHGGGSIEEVISHAAGVGLHALQQGKAVELCTSAGDRVEITPGTDSTKDLLRALAVMGPASAPMSASLRWAGGAGEAVWAPERAGSAEVVLVTTPAGARSPLPGPLDSRARKLVVH